MKGSIKANLIVFLIIAVAAFCISTTFASLSVHEDNDSYKLKALDNDSFEPNYIEKVPTIIPKNTTNTTNTTDNLTHEGDDDTNLLEDTDITWEDIYEYYDEDD